MVLIIKIIKKILAFAAVFLLLEKSCAYCEEPVVNISAQSAVVMWNGEIIYEKQPGIKLPVASTTKLMTALIAAERCNMGERIEVVEEDCRIEGSTMYLRPGETVTAEELLEGLLLESGNDAAASLARYIAGDILSFVQLMNERASELSMTSTHFCNPHGLPADGHYSTAEDMALLMQECLKNETVRNIMAMKSCAVNGRTLINHNKLLYKCKGCTGGKTGYTEAAGRCLVSSCKRNGAELVCVTLNAPDDWNDHIYLYDRAFSEYSIRNVTEGMRFSVPVIGGKEKWAHIVPETEAEVFVSKKSQVAVTAKLPWFTFAPVESGEAAGKAIITVDGKYRGEYPLICSEDIESDNS